MGCDWPGGPRSAAMEPSYRRAAHEEPPAQQSAYAEADETWCEELTNAGRQMLDRDPPPFSDLRPRRLLSETTLPGCQRMLSTARTSRVSILTRGEDRRPACALAVHQELPFTEPTLHQAEPLGVSPASFARVSVRRVRTGQDGQSPVQVAVLPQAPCVVNDQATVWVSVVSAR